MEVSDLVQSVSMQLEGRGDPAPTGTLLSTPTKRAQFTAALGTQERAVHFPQQSALHPLDWFNEVGSADILSCTLIGQITAFFVTEGSSSTSHWVT